MRRYVQAWQGNGRQSSGPVKEKNEKSEQVNQIWYRVFWVPFFSLYTLSPEYQGRGNFGDRYYAAIHSDYDSFWNRSLRFAPFTLLFSVLSPKGDFSLMDTLTGEVYCCMLYSRMKIKSILCGFGILIEPEKFSC